MIALYLDYIIFLTFCPCCLTFSHSLCQAIRKGFDCIWNIPHKFRSGFTKCPSKGKILLYHDFTVSKFIIQLRSLRKPNATHERCNNFPVCNNSLPFKSTELLSSEVYFKCIFRYKYTSDIFTGRKWIQAAGCLLTKKPLKKMKRVFQTETYPSISNHNILLPWFKAAKT